MKKIRKMKDACAVIALCHASGVDEETVLRVCLSCGLDGGMTDYEWTVAAGHLGIKMRAVPGTPCLLRKFKHDHPRGLFLLTTHDHIFCLDNGVVFDPAKSGKVRIKPGQQQKIYMAYRVKKTLPT